MESEKSNKKAATMKPAPLKKEGSQKGGLTLEKSKSAMVGAMANKFQKAGKQLSIVNAMGGKHDDQPYISKKEIEKMIETAVAAS